MKIVLMPLFLFVLGIITDFLWCKATQHATKYHPWRAGLFSGMLTAVGLVSYWEILKIDSFFCGACYVVGSAVGAFLTSRKKYSDNKLKV